jgi:hypothetical protein
LSHFRLDFDLASLPTLPLKTAALAASFVLAAALLVYVTDPRRTGRPDPTGAERLRMGSMLGPAPPGYMLRSIALRLFPFSLAGAGFVFALYIGQYLPLLNARLAGRYQVAEGCLTSFRSASNDTESDKIQLANHTFTYANFENPSFGQTESHGGPIHADSRVRLGFVGSKIVRVETIDEDCPSASDVLP